MLQHEEMHFRYTWRPYQKRVIDAIEAHLDDKRLHIVAAPGAGKTTLGLEVFRLLKKPSLVLSPTRVIRDQWIDRLKDFFDGEDVQSFDWVSNSIKKPTIFTSITYQALHSQFSEELDVEDLGDEGLLFEDDSGLENQEVNSFIALIKENNFEVLILDEAHHLRKAWWRALDMVCKQFPNMVLVSLTATPPYDSQDHEWTRYEQLCGTIDEEISVPELVKAGNLCAHQDFIWACNVNIKEKQQIEEYDNRVKNLCSTLFNSNEFEAIVLSHSWLSNENIEHEVIKEPQIVIAILSFMKAKNCPDNPRLMALLDLTINDIPDLGRRLWQTLIETLLFSSTYQLKEDQKEFVAQLKKRLRETELLHKRMLSLERSRRIERSLALSATKVLACAEIHAVELQKRGDNLRQVVLTDYIRDASLHADLDDQDLTLGAWPVYRTMTSDSPIADEIALLTGRVSIIHISKVEALLKHVERDRVNFEAISRCGQYHKVSASLNLLTEAFTALLMSGNIKVLVGTRALLGEGWDAPAVNSLILASSIGSFMLTNQMRGRAIRISSFEENKMSSIWHLAAINKHSVYSGWRDFENLKRRFDTFVGLNEKDLTIESGFNRMHLSAFSSVNMFANRDVVRLNNNEMKDRVNKIEDISIAWKRALTLEDSARVVPSVLTEKKPKIRAYFLQYSLGYLLVQLLTAASPFLFWAHYNQDHGSKILLYMALAVGAILLYKLPKTIKVIRILFRFLPVDGAVRQIGEALAEALNKAGFIETSARRSKVRVIKNNDGSFYAALDGCTFYESSLFADCMAEILSPIDDPRYLVMREQNFLLTRRVDYHSVPIKFAVKKNLAEIFYKSWTQYLGDSELVYTRTAEGRKRLLKAKMKAFSSNFKDEVKRLDRWQ